MWKREITVEVSLGICWHLSCKFVNWVKVETSAPTTTKTIGNKVKSTRWKIWRNFCKYDVIMTSVDRNFGVETTPEINFRKLSWRKKF